MIRIQTEAIDSEELVRQATDEDSGAVVLFLGTTRKTTDGRETVKLEYDCYEPMALSELSKLRDQAMKRWPIRKCLIVHRVGVVKIGEASVAIALSGPHRTEAFESCQWIMNRLKRDVPIWKREQWTDGSTDWIHPELEN